MRTKYPDLPRTLETDGQEFEQLTSKAIIDNGIIKNDPLCMKVVDKFAEIYGAEVGNAALKTLPYGGIYLTSGVTIGILKHLR